MAAREKLRKENITATARESVENAVNKNEVAVTKANSVLSDDKASEHEITNSLTTLGSTITNVYKALENIGINNFSAVLSATEGYTLETTEKRHENGEFSTELTGKSYEILDGNDKYRVYVHGYQAENSETKIRTNPPTGQGGRTDIPLSRDEARKLSNEAKLWSDKLRPTGTLNKGGVVTYGSNGGYEFIATEIYGYAYEQGKHYVYVKDVKNRFTLSEEAKAAGYRISNVNLENLAPGLGYDEKNGYYGRLYSK